jgi:hypothetical protein
MRQRIKLEFGVNWILLVALVSIALVVAHYFAAEGYRPWLIYTASVIGGAGALIAGVTAIDARGDQLRQDKADAAISFIQLYLNPQFFHAKTNGREVLQKLKDLKTEQEQAAYLQSEPVKRANLLDLLNFFEALAVGIKADHVDEETAKNFFRSMLIEYWNGAEAHIKKRRAERMNPRLSNHMEWLYDRWKN